MVWVPAAAAAAAVEGAVWRGSGLVAVAGRRLRQTHRWGHWVKPVVTLKI